MAKRPGEKRDFMQVAREVVERAIGEQMDGSPLETPVDSRDSRYVALGSKGGRIGGKARAKAVQPRQTPRYCCESRESSLA